MKRLAFVFLLGGLAAAARSITIIGGLSNFDVYNDGLESACGFEIEIHGVDPSSIYHTYNYSHFGAPTITNIGTAGNPTSLVRYSGSTFLESGGMTHYGVSLPRLPDAGSIIYRWLYPTPQPEVFVSVVKDLPTHQSEVVKLPSGEEAVRDVVTNETPDGDDGTIFWILPFAKMVPGTIELEDLMRGSPLLNGSRPMGSGLDGMTPERLDPQDKWFNDDPSSDDTASAVFWYKVYADVVTDGVHGPGEQIGTLLDATVTSPVPEPGTMAVLGLGTLALLRRRRR